MPHLAKSSLLLGCLTLAGCGASPGQPSPSPSQEEIQTSLTEEGDSLIDSLSVTLGAAFAPLFQMSPTVGTASVASQAFDPNCITVTGSLLDDDKDGYPTDMRLLFNCREQNGNVTSSLRGYIDITDRSDYVPDAGVIISSDLEVIHTSGEAVSRKRDETRMVMIPMASSMSVDFTVTQHFFNGNTPLVTTDTKMQMMITPDSDRGGARIRLEGSGTARRGAYLGYTLTGNLHYSQDADCIGFDDGQLFMTSNGITTSRTYTGCNQYR